MAGRLAGGFVVDAFTGAGGNAVQLAGACAAVLGIDTSAPRLAAAAHNAALYGSRGCLDLLLGDVLALLPRVRNVRREPSGGACCASANMKLPCQSPVLAAGFPPRPMAHMQVLSFMPAQADAVCMSPPWGGPAYAAAGGCFDMAADLGGLGVGLGAPLRSCTAQKSYEKSCHTLRVCRQTRCSCRRRGAARRTRRRAAALALPRTWAAWASAWARCWRPRAMRCAPAAAAWPCTCHATRCSHRCGCPWPQAD